MTTILAIHDPIDRRAFIGSDSRVVDTYGGIINEALEKWIHTGRIAFGTAGSLRIYNIIALNRTKLLSLQTIQEVVAYLEDHLPSPNESGFMWIHKDKGLYSITSDLAYVKHPTVFSMGSGSDIALGALAVLTASTIGYPLEHIAETLKVCHQLDSKTGPKHFSKEL